jgi:hypothetical protein
MEHVKEISKSDFLQPGSKVYRNTEMNFHYSDRGQFIVNAFTGRTYSFKVGSIDEKKLWRVVIPIVKNDIVESIKLFYDSPNEYECHRSITVENEQKYKWVNTKILEISSEIITQHPDVIQEYITVK